MNAGGASSGTGNAVTICGIAIGAGIGCGGIGGGVAAWGSGGIGGRAACGAAGAISFIIGGSGGPEKAGAWAKRLFATAEGERSVSGTRKLGV